VELDVFDSAAEVLRGLLPSRLGSLRQRPRRYGLKVWFGPAEPPREHYEAQILGAQHVAGAKVLVIEIGFHSEHPKPADNDAAMAAIAASEPKWRKALGDDPVLGPFLGRDTWRRVSETWVDPDMSVEGFGVDVGLRLADYITALEPLRRAKIT
jgi:hypothetical protein